MGGKGTTTAGDVVKFILQAVAMPSYGATLYISLHNADPLASGDQTTNETAYGSYARQAVNRDNTGWNNSGANCTNAGVITFPSCSSGTDTLTHVGIGTTLASTGQLLYFGPLTSSVPISTTVTPQFAIGTLSVLEA